YFASAVGTSIISEVPVIGPPLQELLRGGTQMGTLTISRFFVLHVFVLPGMLIAFIGMHLFLFRKAGPAGPIKEDPIEPRLPAQSFYPRQIVMDMAAALAVILALGLAAYFIPVRLGPEAVASDTNYIPRPEWYYVPIFEWLKLLGGKWSLFGGIILPGILAVIFAAIPFIDRGRQRRPWRRPVVVGGFVFFAASYAALGAISYRADTSEPLVAAQLRRQQQAEINFMGQPFKPESPSQSLPGSPSQSLEKGVASPADPLTAKGAAIYAAGPCAGCHGAKGEGTDSAPRLVGVGQKYNPNQLSYLLHHRTQSMIAGGMPPVDLNPADTQALVVYLRSLK
ncbi:MAG TPA: cytochrome b N-terminal domain-containing protein, partial [Terracidiphilus sp.]